MDKRSEQIVALAGGVAIVWLVVDAVLSRTGHLLVVAALLPFTVTTVAVAALVYVRARLARLVDEEKRDQELARQEAPSSTLFDREAGKFEPFSLARTRQQFERWFVPAFSLALVGVQVFWAWRLFARLDQPLPAAGGRLAAAALLAGQAFLLFLLSRYLLGMARHEAYRLLRGPGVWLGITCLVSLVAAITAVVAEVQHGMADRLVAFFLIALLGVLAVEGLLNFIAELYRPRRAGDVARSYESRLAGLLTDPAGWARNVAGALDYQFGFKVSETWLYRFLENALLPLLAFQLAVLYLLSCLVFLGPDEEGIVERLGKPRADAWRLAPGAHLKLPWPFETVRRFPTRRVQRLEVGFKHDDSRPTAPGADPNLILWNVPHYTQEDQFLTASRELWATNETAAASVPVNLVSFNVPVEYEIRDLYKYAYSTADARKALEQAAYRSLTQEAAARDLFELMGSARRATAAALQARIQREADRLGLGVEVTFVGIRGVHPPTTVAEAFQSVIGSLEEREATILKARADAVKVVPLASAEGNRLVLQAEAGAVRRTAISSADADRFLRRLDIYHQSPAVFRSRIYLDTLRESLAGTRKYIVAINPKAEVLWFNFEEKLAPDLFDLGPAPKGREGPKTP